MNILSIPDLHSSRNLEQPAFMAPSSALLLPFFFLLLLSPTVSSIPPPEILYPKQAVPTKSGYLPTNTSSSSLFFAFYEAQEALTSPSSTPIILWLQGGPGCSSMIGNLFEFGPYLLSSDLHLLPNPFTWNRRLALLFIDSPIATGFSHSSSPLPRDQESIASNLYSALQSFLSSQPPFFRSRPLFLSGQSYGGKFVVSVAHHILLQNQNPIIPPSLRINLAGISIGNGMIHPNVQVRVHAAAAYSFGLINKRQRAKLERMQDLAAELAREEKWSAATDARNRVLTRLKKDTGLATLLNIKKKHKYATAKLKKFLNKDEVKSALGVEKTTAWVRCNKVVKKALHDDVMKSVKTMVEDVVRKTRVLLYEGALDLKDGVLSVVAWVKEMEWEGTPRFLEARREAWRVEGEVAGSVQSWGNLTHVVVFGAGHLAAADRRMNTQAMIEGWVMQTEGLFGK